MVDAAAAPEPCPFCGSENTKIVAPLGFGNIRAVQCANQLCSVAGPWGKTREEAVAAWNQRAAAPTAPAEPLAAQRRGFPVLGSGGQSVDWQLVADHGKQARANHYQSVELISKRGGLSWSELHAVLHNRQWQRVDENTAIIEVRALEARYLAALTRPPAQNVVALEETLQRIQRIAERCGDLPDTEGLRRAYRDIDSVARAALAKLGSAL